MELSTQTIPDIFENVPKPISPRIHKLIDIITAAGFFTAGAIFWGRKNKRAAISAFMNGGMVAGITAFTDYDGDGKRPISLRLHANLDVLQAASAAADPVLLGIATEPSASFFYSQAAVEMAVVALTDWDAGSAVAGYESTGDHSYQRESA